jgi:hypothetical protein
MSERAGAVVPGRCAEHGGLMWSNAMRACITPDDVIRGGCRWQPLAPEAIGMVPVPQLPEETVRMWMEYEP